MNRNRPLVVMGIDPGPEDSAWVVWDGGRLRDFCPASTNTSLIESLASLCHECRVNIVGIEQIRGFGLPAGNALFDTLHWSGRFHERLNRLGTLVVLMPRKDAVLHLTGARKNGDKEIREALTYRFGEPGTKKKPGVLYGISGSHLWAALAVAVTVWDDAMGKVAVVALPGEAP